MHNIVIKLGGTSQSVHGYKKLIESIKHIKGVCHDTRIVVVLSAVSDVTNNLVCFTKTKNLKYIDEAVYKNRLLQENLCLGDDCMESVYEDLHVLSLNYMSYTKEDITYRQAEIIGFGENMSTHLLCHFFKNHNVSSVLINARSFIKAKKNTFKLYPLCDFYGCEKKFEELAEGYDIVVTQGFIGSTPLNEPVLLGRGGSDTTGSLIANMLNAYEYQVWTDVDGIYTCDPKLIHSAHKVDEISYDLVNELSYSGAKVMHPQSIKPCQEKNIPIVIKNTFSKRDFLCEGTIIKNVVYGDITPVFIAVQKGINVFKIKCSSMNDSFGFVNEIFEKFTRRKIAVDIVTTSKDEIVTTTNESDVANLKELVYDLTYLHYNVHLIENCSIVSVISPNVTEQLTKIDTSTIKRHIIHISSNLKNLNFVVDKHDADDIAKNMYGTLFN